ncbi:OpgC domain-containing protein [Roseicella aerolata]|uniref:OpgC domain-containing protein n=1 Tax=Roseicella aerolata TaxID=2883479 RepID=A0A9X1LAU6_9PROT|nr:OpgC domain-containing protein [Roseicella aerolata]MCB4825174.1 OpgC domain-containing protein [Roseicella aerolata]
MEEAMTRGTVPVRPPRDLRLDVLRGWMQISIFISHVAGTRFIWGIHASWGLSDSSEQFVLLSGLTLGSVFALKMTRDSFGRARADLLRRTIQLYGTHLAVLCAFAALVLGAEAMRLLPGEVARLHWTLLVERPWVAVPAAAALLYQPDLMGILPVFVGCMLLLPGFLSLAHRAGAWALLPSVALYAAVQGRWVATPTLFENGIAFDPLAWQFLFLLGAWIGHRSLLHGPIVSRSALLLAGAAAMVLFGLWARLVGYGLLPGPVFATAVLAHKEVLAPARLLHALSLAYLVAVLVPREVAWMRLPLGRMLACIGRNSLRVFCAGLFLAWGTTTTLRLHPEAATWLDPLLIAAGVAALALVAWLAERGRSRVGLVAPIPQAAG